MWSTAKRAATFQTGIRPEVTAPECVCTSMQLQVSAPIRAIAKLARRPPAARTR